MITQSVKRRISGKKGFVAMPKHSIHNSDLCPIYIYSTRCISNPVREQNSLYAIRFGKKKHYNFVNTLPNFLLLLGKENGTVADLALVEVVHGLLDTLSAHGVVNGNGENLVVGGKVEHTLLDVARSDEGALDGETLGDERHVRDLEVTVGNGKREDDGTRGHDGGEKVPVGLERGGDQKTVDGLGSLELLDTLGSDKLGCTESEGLLLLTVSAGEDDDLATHLGGELDGQVTKTSNADNTDAVGRLDVVKVKSHEDGGTTAHEGSGGLVGKAVGEGEEESLAPDGVGSKRSLVEVVVTIELAVRAESLGTLETLLAVTTAVVLVAPANAVTLLEVLGERTKLLYDTDTLVAKDHAGLAEVLVSSTETGSGNLDEDLITGKLRLVGGALDNGARVGAAVDGERRHDEGRMGMKI